MPNFIKICNWWSLSVVRNLVAIVAVATICFDNIKVVVFGLFGFKTPIHAQKFGV